MKNTSLILALVILVGSIAAEALLTPQAHAEALTRAQIAEEAGFVRDRSGSWLYEACVIVRIYPAKGEVVAAERRESDRDNPEAGGLVVSAAHDRFGVELGRNFVYCQEAVEIALARSATAGSLKALRRRSRTRGRR